jgi:TPR repeat protein
MNENDNQRLVELYESANVAVSEGAFQRAHKLLKPLAESGDAEAQFLLGNLFYAGSDMAWDVARQWLNSAAEQNHAEALYCLASTGFEPSLGEVAWRPPVDKAECRLLQRAAELGSAQAQRDLGAYFSMGDAGFAEDQVQGRHWYLHAAEQGHIDAQYNLGMMLLEGEGGAEDVSAGMAWLVEASKSDDDPAAQEAAELLSEIYGEGLYGHQIDRQKAKIYSQLARELKRVFDEDLA